MSRHPITEQHLVLTARETADVSVERDVSYGISASLGMNIYRSTQDSLDERPAVVLATGYSDAGAIKLLGCKIKDMASYEDWGRLLASRGLVAVTYENEEPWRDARALLDHLHTHADALGIDPERVALWSCSGNVPTALALLAARDDLVCAVLAYGYMLDAPGHTETADGAAQFGFSVPNVDIALDALRRTPMLIVRAGRDETPGLNVSLDGFVERALGANLPISLLNHPEAPHAFDITDPSIGSRAAVRHMLDYLCAQLLEPNAPAA